MNPCSIVPISCPGAPIVCNEMLITPDQSKVVRLGLKALKDLKDLKDMKDLKELKDLKDQKDLKELKDLKDQKDHEDLLGENFNLAAVIQALERATWFYSKVKLKDSRVNS